MSVNLPFDVLHTIIEMLRKDEPPDFTTIQFVSQTCRSLLPVCRRHLFSAIWLKSRIDGADVANQIHARSGNLEPTLHIGATNLANLVASSPDIAGYVREFIFYPHASNSGDETLLSLLQKFDRLEKLHFRHHHDKEPWTRYQNWDDLHYSLQIAMEDLVHQQRRTLTYLFFTDHENIPISILHPLTCLHTFYLFDSTMYTDVIANPLAPLQLTSLGFTAGYSAVQSLFEGVRPGIGLSFLDLSQLRIFTATISSTRTVDEGVSIGRLLRGMSQLKKLDIYVRRKQR
jgi:hypothetical protein